MAVLVGSATALSTNANTKTAQLITGSYEFVGAGRITLVARGSATGMYATLTVGGVALVNDLPIPFTGAAGALDVNAHVMASQRMKGGRVELYLRNTTGGALTTDYQVFFDP